MEDTHQENEKSLGSMTALDDDLDELALERLELLDDLLKNKQMLAEYMKTGFFNLGKARYSLGSHAVSALRIPETSIFAATRSVNSQELSNSNVEYTDRKIINCEKKEEEKHFLGDSEPSKQVEEVVGFDSGVNVLEEANKKPINWFSALPPTSLRRAQIQFEAALQLAAQCVSLQDKLSALDEKYTGLLPY